MKTLVAELAGTANTTAVLSIYFWPMFIGEENARSQRENNDKDVIFFPLASSHAPSGYQARVSHPHLPARVIAVVLGLGPWRFSPLSCGHWPRSPRGRLGEREGPSVLLPVSGSVTPVIAFHPSSGRCF